MMFPPTLQTRAWPPPKVVGYSETAPFSDFDHPQKQSNNDPAGLLGSFPLPALFSRLTFILSCWLLLAESVQHAGKNNERYVSGDCRSWSASATHVGPHPPNTNSPPSIWLWVKNVYPFWNPSKWNQGLKPAVQFLVL